MIPGDGLPRTLAGAVSVATATARRTGCRQSVVICPCGGYGGRHFIVMRTLRPAPVRPEFAEACS